MVALDTLSFRDLVILTAAIVGVGGSYLLYRKRRLDTAANLRHALYAEVGTMGDQIHTQAIQMKSAELTTDPYLPEESPVVPTVYRNNAGELGRLTTDEIEALASFYTAAELVDERLGRAIASEGISRAEALYLRAKLVELNNLNNAALDALEAELDCEPVGVDHRARLEGAGSLTLDEIRDRMQIDGPE